MKTPIFKMKLAFAFIAIGVLLSTTMKTTAQGYYGQYFNWIASNSSIISDWTVINNANLDGVVGAKVLFTPKWDPNGIYNNFNSGIWYDGSNWDIYNENTSDSIPVGSSFNILIPSTHGTIFTHTVTATGDYMTTINNLATNGDPNKLVFITHNFGTAGGVINNHAAGVWYDGSNWEIYNENLVPLSTGTVFNVFAVDSGANAFVHQATIANSFSNYTVIDNPLLNGNPNASIIVTHNYNPNYLSSAIYDTIPLGVWFNGANWTIYHQDMTPITNLACYNVLICGNINAGITGYFADKAINLNPNPAKDNITITCQQQSIIEISNFEGQRIKTLIASGNKTNIDISALPSGVYFVEVKTEKEVAVTKFIKE